jgi:hypothetical protein
MTKIWPDPSAWVSNLLHELKGLDAWFLTYEGIRSGRLHLTQDDLDRRGIIEPIEPEITHQYARTISRIIEALELLPPFATGEGLAALRALRYDLVSLDEGGTPDRIRPRPSTSKGGDNRGQRVAKAHIVSFVRLLEELDVRNKPARETVAAAFKAEGFRVSASSLTRWTDEIGGASSSDPNASGRRLVEAKLAEWKSDPTWPFSLVDAERMIRTAAAGVTISLAHTT